MSLTPLERDLVHAVAAQRDELVALASDLVRFDTTAREVGDPAREEAALQARLAERLRDAGAEVDVWEPDATELAGRPLVPDGIDFVGRPQLAVTFHGDGGGRSLLLNGHIDVVSGEPREQWTSDPNEPEVRAGRLYGRGACDMKGGIAAMVVAAETVTRFGRLAGDLTVCTNTDEESSGAGGMALVARGVRADAGISPEPTGFDVWNACRGSVLVTIEVAGRPGHAEMPQPHWRDGGAVNAIEKANLVLDVLRTLRGEWLQRDALAHAELAPADIIPTAVAAGEWLVTHPASCRITCVLPYPPAQADEDGWSSTVEREVAEHIARAAAKDDWLADNPPSLTWFAGVMPMDVPADSPIVTSVLGASSDVGRHGRPAGLNSWFDGATLTRFAGTPTVAFGPSGKHVAHTVDEFVSIDDLVACAQAIAVAATRFCGLSSAAGGA